MDPLEDQVRRFLRGGGQIGHTAGHLGHVGGVVGLGKPVCEIDMPSLEGNLGDINLRAPPAGVSSPSGSDGAGVNSSSWARMVFRFSRPDSDRMTRL